MRIMIVGAGYVGLSLGVVLSSKHEVLLKDINSEIVEKINTGISPIYENGIQDRLQSAVSDGRLRAANATEKSGSRDIILICVGTPSSRDGSVDLRYVKDAVEDIMAHLHDLIDKYTTITIKSTVPPGTTRRVLSKPISTSSRSASVGIAFNPEFLREGSAIKDALNPDRIVIGTNEKKAFRILQEMYTEVVQNSPEYVHTSIESAELSKYVANSFLATKISFANEWANICERIPGADIDEVMNAASLDSRICGDFFGAGAGYGGSCFPKDVRGAIHFAEGLSEDLSILRSTEKVNASRPKRLVSILRHEVGDLQDRKIALLGVTFKPGTDDTRESPALKVLELLCENDAYVCVHDPLANQIALEQTDDCDMTLTDDIELCMQNAHACVLVTDWDVYKQIGLKQLAESMEEKVFIDGRRALVQEKPPKGIIYRTVGKYF